MAKAPASVEYKTDPRPGFGVSLLAIAGLETVVNSIRHLCLLCAEEIKDEATALNHSAYHLICTPDRCATLSAEPCALCLGFSCSVVVIKTSSGLQPRICCRVFAPSSEHNPELGVVFAAKRMASCTAASPTTNHPIVCPKCHPELTDESSKKRKKKIRPAVMSYNFRNHWEQEHKGAPFPADLEAQIALKEHEKAMLQVHRGKQPLSKDEMARFTTSST